MAYEKYMILNINNRNICEQTNVLSKEAVYVKRKSLLIFVHYDYQIFSFFSRNDV